MRTWSKDDWTKVLQGYLGRSVTNNLAERNLDAYTGDVVKTKYLPRYSTRELDPDYNDRLDRAKNNYFNFPKKVLNIYRNSIFRQTEPTRDSDNKDIQQFWLNADGNKTPIGRLVKDKVFTLQQITGGCLVVVDKPRIPDELQGLQISRQQQEQFELFPYVYCLPWSHLVNYSVDQFGRYEWVILEKGKDAKGNRLYKIWDKADWWVVDQDQVIVEGGLHNLGAVPVLPCIAIGDPRPGYNFQVPISPLNDVVSISLKIFEEMSRLDQMVVMHIFLRIAMPESMFKKIQEAGSGNVNALVYPDGYQGVQAHYVEVSGKEIETMIDLIFDKYPHMILEMADIRSKTDKPREESGVAKFIDSSDELANLIEKAESIEEIENRITDLYKRWEGIDGDNTTISYSKNFDVKSVNEQLQEMTTIFKEDLHAPTFAKALVKRVTRKMLGNIDEGTWANIEQEIEESVDPALDLADITTLINMGALNVTRIAKRYNPELKTDEDVAKFVQENLQQLRGVPEFNSDFNSQQ